MAQYPTQKDIMHWTSAAIDIFQSIMPPIDKPYPRVYIATSRTFLNMRAELIAQTGCVHTHTEESEAAIMEYIHGDKGCVILIRQNLLPDNNEDHFCEMLWHELGAEWCFKALFRTLFFCAKKVTNYLCEMLCYNR